MLLILFLYLVAVGAGYWLKYLNLSYLKANGGIVPAEFRGSVDSALLQKIANYTFENNRVGIIESVLSNVLLLLFLFGGLLGVYDGWVSSLGGPFIVRGLLFAVFLLVIETLIDIPFSLYRNFKIENKYDFNTMTFRLWLIDLLKSSIISAILGGIVVTAGLLLVAGSPGWWWLWVWAFLLIFGIFVMYVSPYLIEPLFYKFEPVKAEGLEDRIRQMMDRTGLRVSRVFQVDASRRSRHSNAYFTGIGRVKRIVLFDTLIEQMSQEEILAVLAHEVGHWKKRHVLKRILLTESMAFLGLFIAYQLIQWEQLPGLVRMQQASFYARVLIVGFLGSLAAFPFTPLFSYLSRRDELQADRFASDLTGNPEALASALIKLSRENLSNLHPHPLYAKFYYSHPPVVERIRKLRSQPSELSD